MEILKEYLYIIRDKNNQGWVIVNLDKFTQSNLYYKSVAFKIILEQDIWEFSQRDLQKMYLSGVLGFGDITNIKKYNSMDDLIKDLHVKDILDAIYTDKLLLCMRNLNIGHKI